MSYTSSFKHAVQKVLNREPQTAVSIEYLLSEVDSSHRDETRLTKWLASSRYVDVHTDIVGVQSPLYAMHAVVPTHAISLDKTVIPLVQITLEDGDQRYHCMASADVSHVTQAVRTTIGRSARLHVYDEKASEFVPLTTTTLPSADTHVITIRIATTEDEGTEDEEEGEGEDGDNTPMNEKTPAVAGPLIEYTNSVSTTTLNAITPEMLATCGSQKVSSEMRIAQNAISHGNVSKVLMRHGQYDVNHTVFSNELDIDMAISDQQSSGRCWIFGFTNILRMHMIHRYALPPSFEFSNVYLYFYDQLEKCNLFLNHAWALQRKQATNTTAMDDPYLRSLLQNPVSDGGQWHMLINLVKKYGVVPKQCMNETTQSNRTSRMTTLMNGRLREWAYELRFITSTHEAKGRIDEMLVEIHRILSIFLGTPPATIAWDYSPADKDKKDKKEKKDKNKTKRHEEEYAPRHATQKRQPKEAILSPPFMTQKNGDSIPFKLFKHVADITPTDFFHKCVNDQLGVEDYICVINYPHETRPMHRWYTVKYLNNIIGRNDTLLLNVNIDEMKDLTRKAIDSGEPVWFAGDVSKDCSLKYGILDPAILDYESVFHFQPHAMDKGQRMVYQDGSPDHAMMFKGYHKEHAHDSKISKWLVENSWGEDAGKKGNLVMSDAWFEKHVFNVAVHRKHLETMPVLKACLAKMTEDVIEMEPWDTFGNLFV
jgi:bleomycin hydrolase